MMQSRKAQLSTMKKLLLVLMVIIIITVYSGQLFAQARHQVETEFDPNKFYNNDQEGEDVLAPGVADLLPVDARNGARDIPFMLFNHNEFGATGNGKLVLISDFNDKQPFFDEQDGNIGMQFVSSNKGIVVYFTKANNKIESKSLFLSYETDSYLKNKQICVIPPELHLPLISAVTGIQSGEKSPPVISLSALPEKYKLSYIGFRSLGKSYSSSPYLSINSVNGVKKPLEYTPVVLTGSYVDPKLTLIHGTTSIVIPDESTSGIYIGGLLVWIYGNNLCILDRGFTISGIQYDDKGDQDSTNDELVISSGDKRASDLLVKKLIDKGDIIII